MTQINLLPWRDRQREQEKIRFRVQLSGSVVAATFLVFLINYYASSLMSNQSARNQMLQNEVSIIDEQLKEITCLKKNKKILTSRISLVHHLQSARILIVHLFNELINITPSGVYLTQLNDKQSMVSITGYAESNSSISMLMKNIENNEWMHHPILNEIKREDKLNFANNGFKLTFILAPPFEMRAIQ